MVANQHLTEVFRTKDGAVYQNDRKRCLVIEFLGESACYDVKGFFHLKELVDKVNIFDMIQDASNQGDMEIINPLHSDRCYVLNLCEILKLRSLLNGAKVMLELNSIIQERIYTQLVLN